MKNKLLITAISAAVVLLLILILGAPWAIGTLFQNRLNLAVDTINNQNLPFTATISNYQRGWFTATATIELSAEDSPQTLMSLPVKIYHGPVIYYNNRLHLALGSYRGNINAGKIQGAMQGWIGLSSHLYSQIQIDPTKIQQGDNSSQIGTVDINYYIPLASLKEMQADIRIKQISGQIGAFFTGDLNNLAYRIAGKQQADASWNWDLSIGLGNSQFALQNPLNGQMEKLSWQTIQLQHLVSNSTQINQLITALQSQDTSNLLQQSEDAASVMINSSSHIQVVGLKGDMNIFNFLVNLDLAWPELPKQHNFKDLLTYQTLQFSLLVPQVNYQDTDSGISIKLNNFSLQESYKRSQGMQASLKLDNLAIKDQQSFNLTDLNWQAQSDAKALNNAWQISIANLCSNNNCFKNSSLNMVVNNINTDAAPDSIYQDFSKAQDQFDQNSDLAIWQTFLQKDIAPALNAKSLIKVSFDTETPYGAGSFVSNLSWPDFKATADVFSNTVWHLAMSVPNYYMAQLLQYQNNPGNIAYPNSLGLNSNSQTANFLGQWLKNGYILHQDQHYSLMLDLQNSQLSLQKKPVDALNLGYLAFNLGWYPLSLQQFALAADAGNRYGQFYVGLQYALGLGVERDAHAAVKWLTLSAKQNYSNAALVLGGLYYKGSLVPADYNQALYWLKLGAAQNDPRAQTALGNLYAAGASQPTIASDYQQAAHWYYLAAQQGYAPAEYRLAQCYEKGQGVAQDLNKAYSLYQAAASQHLPHASEAADSIANELSQEENGD